MQENDQLSTETLARVSVEFVVKGEHMPEEESLINFPCDFVIKVMGKANVQFEERVINIVLRHYPDTDLKKMNKRPSRSNNFIAITFTVYAKSKKELDALYQELSMVEEVLFAI